MKLIIEIDMLPGSYPAKCTYPDINVWVGGNKYSGELDNLAHLKPGLLFSRENFCVCGTVRVEA